MSVNLNTGEVHEDVEVVKAESPITPVIETAPEAPKGAGAILKEVQSEGATKKPKAPKKPKAEAAPEAPKGIGAPTLDMFNLPAGDLESAGLSKLVFDRRLQHRKDLRNEAAVATYAERMSEGAKFPPIKVIRDTSETADKGKLWVYDGFQRGGAYEKNNTKNVEINVIEGNFADALMLSLASNSENSVIPRTKDDERRSVLALLDNADALAAVLVQGKGQGGAHRAIAKVCGCSTGTVTNALKERNLKASGGKLVKDNTPATTATAASTTPKPSSELAPPAPPAPPVTNAAAQAEVDRKAYSALCDTTLEARFSEMRKTIRRLGALTASFVEDASHGQVIREHLEAEGLAIGKEWDTRKAEQGKDFNPLLEIMELWPAVPNLTAVFDGCKKIVETRKAAAEAEAKAKEAAATGAK